jgi:hypothetical protein
VSGRHDADERQLVVRPGVRIAGSGSATMTVAVQNNTISQVADKVIARDGSNRINATIRTSSR